MTIKLLSAFAVVAMGVTASRGDLQAPRPDGFSIRGGLVEGATDGPDFWALEFTRDGERYKLDNRADCRRRMEEVSGARRFIWEGLSLPGATGMVDVVATVKDGGAGQTEWLLKVANRDARWALRTTHYPYFRNVARHRRCDLLYPGIHLGAKLMRNYKRAARHRTSEGGYTMVTAFMADGEGLYFAAHDGEGRTKILRWSAHGDAWFETLVENAGVPGRAADGPGYPVVSAPFRGDWWQAAKIYRAWALRQRWAAKGPIVYRRDHPRALSEVDTWFRLSSSMRPDTAAALVSRTRPDLKTGFRYYSWNVEVSGQDNGYPNFTPRPNTKDVVADAKARGIVVMPYVNGKIWDSALPSYRDVVPWMITDEKGGIVAVTYSGRPFGVVCPSVPGWREKLLEMEHVVVDTVGANGIYYDQIGIAPGKPCWNPAHGHPLGGGRWWTAGYHDALAAVRARTEPKGVSISTEGIDEVYMDVVDAFLVVGRQAHQEDIPFFPAVYSGYTVYFNTEVNETDSPPALFAYLAQMTFQGVSTGTWRNKGLFDGRLAAQSRIIHRLGRLRSRMRDYLAYGCLEDELRPLDRLEEVTYTYSPTRPHKKHAAEVKITYPAAIGYAWRTIDAKRRALFVANVTDRPVSFRLRLPDGMADSALTALPGEEPAQFSAAGDGTATLMLPAGALAVIESQLR